jgi:hypothetical protein
MADIIYEKRTFKYGLLPRRISEAEYLKLKACSLSFNIGESKETSGTI